MHPEIASRNQYSAAGAFRFPRDDLPGMFLNHAKKIDNQPPAPFSPIPLLLALDDLPLLFLAKKKNAPSEQQVRLARPEGASKTQED